MGDTTGFDAREGTLCVLARFGVYTILLLTVALLAPAAIEHLGRENCFRENGFVEWVEFGELIACAAVLSAAAWRSPMWRGCLSLLAALPAAAAMRELDNQFDDLIPVLGWTLPVALVLAAGVVLAWRNRNTLLAPIPQIVRHRSFGLMWGGLIAAGPLAQIIGHKPMLIVVMGKDSYQFIVKQFFEETCEQCGYLMLLIGCIELLLAGIACQKSSARLAAS